MRMPVTTYVGAVPIASDTASWRTRESRSSTNSPTRVGHVDLGEPLVAVLQRLGRDRRVLGSSSRESSRSVASPATSAAIDAEHAHQDDDDGQPPRQHPRHERHDGVDQQGDDAARNDPADRAVGEHERLGEHERRDDGGDHEHGGARRQPGTQDGRPRHAGSAIGRSCQREPADGRARSSRCGERAARGPRPATSELSSSPS